MPALDPVQALVDMGLTDLEARAYTSLLRQPGMTGYRVAKILGKPAANVYKALESLEAKGAVVVDEGATRHFRPVPTAEFLERLQRRFTERRRLAAEALERLPDVESDTGVYRIRSVDQVLDRCRRMLADARKIVLLDAFPEPLAEIRADVERTVDRGVEVVAKVYAPTEIQGVRIVLEPDHEDLRARWHGTWLTAYVDGRALLYSLLSRDLTAVTQAVWSESPYLGSVLTFGFAFELAYTALKQHFLRGADLETLRARFFANEKYFAERIRPLAAARQWYAYDTPGPRSPADGSATRPKGGDR